jgi:hypothetical protein
MFYFIYFKSELMMQANLNESKGLNEPQLGLSRILFLHNGLISSAHVTHSLNSQGANGKKKPERRHIGILWVRPR